MLIGACNPILRPIHVFRYCDTSQRDAKTAVGKGPSGTFLVRDSKNKQTGLVEKHVLVINDHGKIVSFQIRIQVCHNLFSVCCW